MRLPSGTLDQLEQAFAVIPPNQRDSWRVHRVESGDTATTLAKRYGTTAETIASVNRGEIPEQGAFAAIPVAYPGDRAPVKRTTVKAAVASVRTAKPTVKAAKPVAPSVVAVKATVKKPEVAQAPKKPQTRKPATAVHTPGA